MLRAPEHLLGIRWASPVVRPLLFLLFLKCLE